MANRVSARSEVTLSQGAIALILVALALSASACSTVETPDLETEVREEKIIPQNWQPLPLRVGLAPFLNEPELNAEKVNIDDTPRWVVVPTPERLNGADGLHKRLLDVLTRYKMFERVEAISGARPNSSLEELRKLALAQGLDVVLQPAVKRSDVAYLESNGAYAWSMFMWWMMSPIFTWWIADEDFEVNVHLDMRLYPTANGELSLQKRVQPPETLVRSLDDFDHGFNALSIFSTPGYMGESNWIKVGGKLIPIGENAAYKQTLRYITTELSRKVEDPAFLNDLRRRTGVIIGVDSAGRPGLPLTRYAEADANAISRFVLHATRRPMTDGGVVTLTGPTATRAEVLSAIDAITPISRGNDDVVLAFCGAGTITVDGRLGVALAQPPVTGADTPVEITPLIELVNAALAQSPRTLTLYLDCSFLAKGDSRCAVTDALIAKLPARVENEKPLTLFKPIIKLCEEQGTRLIIISATGAQVGLTSPERALEMEDLGSGLFTAFVLEALSGKADTNKDRDITVAELKVYVEARVAQISELEGINQKPWIFAAADRSDYELPSGKK